MITIRFLRVRFNKVVCIYKSALNCCVRFQRVKSNYYNDDLLSRRISVVVQNISLFSKEEDTTTTKKTQTLRKKKGKNLVAHFFCVKTSFCGSFRVLSWRRIIWCVNSRLFSLLFSLGSERHTKTRRRRRQRRRRKRKTLRFVVNWFPSRSSFRATRKEETFVVYRERGNFFARRVSQTYISSERSNRNFCAQIPRIISVKRGPNDDEQIIEQQWQQNKRPRK